jgi:hypothetical protein
VYFGFYRVALGGLFRDPYFVYQLASISIAGAFTVFFYWRVAYHLARIQRKERSNSLMQPTGEEQPPAD